jgi:diguanylate cyclase (GGDEF)-like protein
MTLFFVLIVVVPMIAVGVLVAQVTRQSTSGKADARLAAGLETALKVYRDDLSQARQAAREVARDQALGNALRSEDSQQIQAAADRLAAQNGVSSLRISAPAGHQLAAVGPAPLVAAARFQISDSGGQPVASLEAAETSPRAYLAEVKRLTGRDAALGGKASASTVPLQGANLPSQGDAKTLKVGGDDVRAATASLPGSDSQTLTLLTPLGSGGFFSSSPLIAAALVVFFVVALMFVVMLIRALQGQVAAMLGAARRIGEGDFSRNVPVVGRDEMAGLASEFNKMSDRLSAQMDELRRQRVEIDRSVRRIGEAFASGLDRPALLEVIAETALSACGAEFARIALTPTADRVEVGATPKGELAQAVEAAEERVASPEGDDLAEARRGEAYALASPLRRIGEPIRQVGTMSVARSGASFTRAEEDVFRYLIGQLSASIENIALHELVSEQAVTDELTGISNNRHFRDVASKEAARAERFGHDLSLLMLDIDDFKQVNDTYGHPQGDSVLQMIGKVLGAESRGVDEPARYGGEEFVLLLPETGLDGAVELADRIRARIEAERVGRRDGEQPLRVTASIGVATMPNSATDLASLISAADQALYVAKRAGKNRVERAPDLDGEAQGGDAADRRGTQGETAARRS